LAGESVGPRKFPPGNFAAAHDLRRTGVLVRGTEGR
jgi:hypothetical protein